MINLISNTRDPELTPSPGFTVSRDILYGYVALENNPIE